MKIKTLTTPRLIMRPIHIDDAARIQENFPHWDIVKHMAATIPWPYPADGAKDFLENVALKNTAAGSEYHWAITEKSDPQSLHIGSITLYPNNPEDSRGFWMASAYQGRGYMKEAVLAVNDFAYDILKMPVLVLNNATDNLGSRRMKELAGAEIVLISEANYVSGKHKQERWHLTAEAWRANRHKFLPPNDEVKAAHKPVSTMQP